MAKFYIKKIFQDNTGQSLIEIIISLAIGVILIGAATMGIAPMLRSNVASNNIQTANSLAQEYLDNLQNIAESNWANVYNPPGAKGSSSQFYLNQNGSTYQIAAGTNPITVQGTIFTRYFSIQNVNRDSCGFGNITTDAITACATGPGTAGVAEDLSTQKITIVVNWPNNSSISRVEYLTRSGSKVFNQSDWSGGSGQTGPITAENNKFFQADLSDYGGQVGLMKIEGLSTTTQPGSGTNIDSVNHYAWNDVLGWIDFYSTGNVVVGDTQLYGYATSSAGYIALDCLTSPNGDICETSNFQVQVNIHSQGQGENDRGFLSGYAWNDAIGWISFSDLSPDDQVKIKGNGKFTGWAWNDIVGWISFNCNNVDCSHPYRVDTSWNPASPVLAWLLSSTFDTQSASSFNNIMWQGIQPTNTTVQFQFATSNNPSGPWDYIGPDGSSNTYYQPAGPGIATPLNSQFHSNQRYFRYKIYLQSDPGGTFTPQVNNVIISWSP